MITKAESTHSTDVTALMDGDLEGARSALVQRLVRTSPFVVSQGSVHRWSEHTVHSNEKIGVMIGLDGGSEDLAKDIAMHVAAVNPMVVNPDDVDSAVIEKEKEIFAAQAENSGSLLKS